MGLAAAGCAKACRNDHPHVPYAVTGTPSTTAADAGPPRNDAACTPVARLERVGPRSALVELGASCTRGAATRAIYVVRLAREPSVAFDAVVSDPPGAAKLTIDVDGADRDNDGIDDIA